jgi:hypothetical protein
VLPFVSIAYPKAIPFFIKNHFSFQVNLHTSI